MASEIRSGSLAAGLPQSRAPEEILDLLVETGGTRVERIVSTGQTSPATGWYDQPHDELVVLVAGAAGLLIEGETAERRLGPGDWVHLPARCRHRVTSTEASPPTVWLAVHFPAGDRTGAV